MNANLLIREAQIEDAPAIADIYNHYVRETHITFDLEPVTVDNRIAWLSEYNQHSRHRLFVGEAEDRIVGYTCSSQFRYKPAYDRSVETTIYLDHQATGQGYGRVLYGHLFDVLSQTDVHRYYGIIALPNEASVDLHHHFGFTERGVLTEVGYKFERYWDTLWMEKPGASQAVEN